MSTHIHRISAASLAMIGVLACTPPNQPETVASPVTTAAHSTETMRGENGASYDRRGDDGTVIAKLTAPAPAVWDALVAAFAARNITPAIVDRSSGRIGDTALVLMRRWNGQPLSAFIQCGTSMTGQRADQDRVRAIFLAQMSRLKGDTIALAVHLSAMATPIESGNGGNVSQCTSRGQAETELIDDVRRRAGR